MKYAKYNWPDRDIAMSVTLRSVGFELADLHVPHSLIKCFLHSDIVCLAARYSVNSAPLKCCLQKQNKTNYIHTGPLSSHRTTSMISFSSLTKAKRTLILTCFVLLPLSQLCGTLSFLVCPQFTSKIFILSLMR